MLNSDDLQKIGELIEKKTSNVISDAFRDFYESILLPHLEKSEREHAQIVKKLEEHDQKFDEIVEHVKDHSTRIRKLEHSIAQ